MWTLARELEPEPRDVTLEIRRTENLNVTYT